MSGQQLEQEHCIEKGIPVAATTTTTAVAAAAADQTTSAASSAGSGSSNNGSNDGEAGNEVDTSINRYNAVNALAFALNVVVTYGFGMGMIADLPSNGELSLKYQTIITPSGYAFAIWGPIFILQFVWVLWQILIPSQRNATGVFAAKYYVVVCLLQAGWTFSFAYEVIWLSLVFMVGILLALFALHRNVDQGVEKRWYKGYWIWQFPFSLHYGWIVAATAVNANLLLVAYGASSKAQLAFAATTLVALLAVAMSFFVCQSCKSEATPNATAATAATSTVDLTPPLVLVWALGAVYAELQDPDPSIADRFSEEQIRGIATGSVVGAAVILFAVAAEIVRETVFASRKGRNN